MPNDDDARRLAVGDDHAGASANRSDEEDHRRLSGSRRTQDRRTPLQMSERLWVTGTLLLISFLVLSVQYIMVVYYRATPAMGSSDLARVLLPFNALSGLLLYNYFLAALSSPGRVPAGWAPPVPSVAGSNLPSAAADADLVEVKRSGAPRWCKVCRAPKPPRAHHCRQCQKCTLRMDHHCPWIANCVGHRNYAAFIRFLAAVDVTCAYHLLMLSARVADAWGGGNMYRSPTTPVMLLMVLNYALCVPVLLLVGMFSTYHFYCAANNSTTIEGWEKDRVATMVRRGRVREIKYPYDLGVLRNLQASLGTNPLLWCWPQPTPGDGLQFTLRQGADPRDAYQWPPKDPNKRKRLHAHDPGTAFKLPASGPFTYGNGFNPKLQPSNGLRRRIQATEGESKGAEEQARCTMGGSALERSALPPYHPDYQHEGHSEEVKYINTDAEAAGMTEGGCLPHGNSDEAQNKEIFPHLWADEDESGESASDSASQYSQEVGMFSRSRVRRGSEGYEVRPKRFDLTFSHDATWQVGMDGGGVGYASDEEGEYSDYGSHGVQELRGSGGRGDGRASSLAIGSDDGRASDFDEDEEGDWAERDAREEQLRRLLHEERRSSDWQPAYDPPENWSPIAAAHNKAGSGASVSGSATMEDHGTAAAPGMQDFTKPLLPSEIMRRRVEWHAHMAALAAADDDFVPTSGPIE